MTFQTSAALVFDFDDLAHGLPVAERVMATAAKERAPTVAPSVSPNQSTARSSH
jgi:hypothetical protein